MNRRILLVCLWGWAISFLWANQSSAESGRFLFVVDTSFSMAPKKETLRNTAYDLIYGGIGGEMKQGDLFSVWTFNENPDTQQFAPVEWNPAQRQTLANLAYAFLKNQPFQKISRFDKALGEILRSTQEAASLTIVILSDGLEFVRGTPFDLEINTAYTQRSSELRRVDKPFITVLQSKRGRVVGWSISAVGEPVRIPPIPATPQSVRTEGPASPLDEKPAFSAREVVAPPPANLSQSGPVTALVRRGSASLVESGTVAKPVVIPPDGPAEDSLASSSVRIEKASAAAETNAGPGRSTDQENKSRSLEPIPPSPGPSSPVNFSSIDKSTIRPVTTLQPPSDPADSVKKTDEQADVKASPGITEGSERAPEDPLVRGGAFVSQEAIVLPIVRGRLRWEYLSLALLSLLAALGLIYFRFLRPSSAPRSSLISSSVNRNAKE
jgi:hypothetical protein